MVHARDYSLSQLFADWRPEGIFWIVYGPNAATSEKIKVLDFTYGFGTGTTLACDVSVKYHV